MHKKLHCLTSPSSPPLPASTLHILAWYAPAYPRTAYITSSYNCKNDPKTNRLVYVFPLSTNAHARPAAPPPTLPKQATQHQPQPLTNLTTLSAHPVIAKTGVPCRVIPGGVAQALTSTDPTETSAQIAHPSRKPYVISAGNKFFAAGPRIARFSETAVCLPVASPVCRGRRPAGPRWMRLASCGWIKRGVWVCLGVYIYYCCWREAKRCAE